MTNFVINKDSKETLTIDGTNNEWFINSDVTLEVAGWAISAEADDDGNEVIIYGDVISKGAYDAIDIAGDFNFIHVGEGGSVTSRQGAGVFFGEGAGNSLLNEGVITGKQFGFLGSNTDIEVENIGEIRSAGIAIKTGSEFDSGLFLENKGLIKSEGNVAIQGGDGGEVIHNSGRIVGDVKLRDNDDTFFFENGIVDGKVFGGGGDDFYYLGKSGGRIVEEWNAGTDSVYSAKTNTLAENIEHLGLLGKNDVNGTGNALSNGLHGNKGDNVLRALGGSDILDGGEGNDDLIGGGGDDLFIMKYSVGRDRVLDFQTEGPNHDIVDLSNFYPGGISTDFPDVQSHLSQHGSDVWIDYEKGDRMILKNVELDDLNETHFSLMSL